MNIKYDEFLDGSYSLFIVSAVAYSIYYFISSYY